MTNTCICTHKRERHQNGTARCLEEQWVIGGPPCGCGEFLPEGGSKRVNIAPEELKFAEWQIKQHQRMIHEIRERYGLKA